MYMSMDMLLEEKAPLFDPGDSLHACPLFAWMQATSGSSGLIEALPDATSIAEAKRLMLKSHNSAS